ncbi:MAG: aminoacyl-tRNA hydrolase [bacterium]
MKLIVGLGNPGILYSATRHNVGFMVVDAIADVMRVSFRGERSLRSRIGKASLDGETLILAKPQTYVNLSGLAVKALVDHYKVPLSDLIVISDDIHLDLGRIRIRRKGSAGGHNGVESIIRSLGSQEFPRVRVGIGPPLHSQIDHVLGRFTDEERGVILDAVARARDAVIAIVKEGVDAAMNRFNKVDPANGR